VNCDLFIYEVLGLHKYHVLHAIRMFDYLEAEMHASENLLIFSERNCDLFYSPTTWNAFYEFLA